MALVIAASGVVGGLLDAEFHGDGVGRLETDAADVARQASIGRSAPSPSG